MKYDDYVWDYKNVVEYEERTKNGTMPPLIISVAITGGVIGKEANPNLPETPGAGGRNLCHIQGGGFGRSYSCQGSTTRVCRHLIQD